MAQKGSEQLLQLRKAGLTQPTSAAKSLQQSLLTSRPHPGDVVDAAAQGAGRAATAMPGQCKAVCLVPYLLQNLQPGISAAKAERL